MNSNRKVTALVAATFLVVASLTGFAGTVAAGNAANSAGDLGIAVEQTGNTGGAIVTVTAGNEAVEGANVTVSTDGNYSGVGNYTTDANGTVSLDAPQENVTINVTASAYNQTVSTTAELTAAEEEMTFANFGQRVSFFVHSLLGSEDTEGGIGQQVSEFVRNNNPSNDKKPDHAGGPENATNNKPDNAGPDKDKGKPAHAGGPNAQDDADGESDDDSKSNNGNGNGNAKGQ